MKKLQIYLIPIAIIIYYYFTKKKVQHLAKVDKKKSLTDKIILDKPNLDIDKTFVDISIREDIKPKDIILPFKVKDKIQQHGELPLEDFYFDRNHPYDFDVPFKTGGLKSAPIIDNPIKTNKVKLIKTNNSTNDYIKMNYANNSKFFTSKY